MSATERGKLLCKNFETKLIKRGEYIRLQKEKSRIQTEMGKFIFITITQKYWTYNIYFKIVIFNLIIY